MNEHIHLYWFQKMSNKEAIIKVSKKYLCLPSKHKSLQVLISNGKSRH